MKKLFRSMEGQSLVEYSLILVMVTIIVIIILALLGPSVGNVFSQVVDQLNSTQSQAPPPPPPTPEPPPECYGTILLPLTLLLAGIMVIFSNRRIKSPPAQQPA